MNKIFSILILSLFIFGFVSAESETYKVRTETNLQFTCVLDGSVADDSSTFNITITDREGNYLVNKKLAQANGGGSFNYTTTFPEVGIYKVTMLCSDGTNEYVTEGEYNITPSGFTGTLGFYFIVLLLSAGVIIFGFSIRDPIATILGSFGLYFMGLYILFNGIDGLKDTTYTWAIGIIILMLAAYISIRSTYELIVD